MLRIICLRPTQRLQFVSGGRGELERVHHTVARIVDCPSAGPHRVLQLQTLKVNPHLTNTGVALQNVSIGKII